MPGGTCRAIFRNACPPDWGVKITQCGAKFFYQDPSGKIIRDYVYYKNTNLSSGGEDFVSSDDPRGCVQQLAAGLTVYVAGQGEKSFVDSYPGSTKKCTLQCAFTLGPKTLSSSVHNDDLSSVLRAADAIDLGNLELRIWLGDMASEDLVQL